MFHWIYFVFLFIALIVANNEMIRNDDNQRNNNTLYIFGIVLICFAGFRLYTGADFMAYYNIYKFLKENSANEVLYDLGMEPTYMWICNVAIKFHLTFLGVLLFYATFSIILKLNFFKESSPYIALSIAIYFAFYYFYNEYGHIRQGAAVAVCVFSFQYIKSRKILWFALCMIVAYYFHKSSILFALAYFIAPLQISTRTALIMLVVSIILIPFEVYQYIGFFNAFSASEGVYDSFNTYINDTYYGQDVGFSWLGDTFKALQIGTILLFEKKPLERSKLYLYARNILIFGFCFTYIFRGNEIFSVRLTGAYLFFNTIVYALLLYYNDEKMRSQLKILIYFIIFAFFIRLGVTVERYQLGKFENMLLEWKNPYQ